jgi:hypothetical protein
VGLEVGGDDAGPVVRGYLAAKLALHLCDSQGDGVVAGHLRGVGLCSPR